MQEELEEFDKQNLWGIVYERIRNEASIVHDHSLMCIREARNPLNRQRNRYRDVSPYDHSRVKLSSEDNDYINGSLVEAPAANRKYILTQGPLPATCGHFWQMTWEQNSKAVVMLNRVIEKGTIKCSQYFPLGAQHGGHDEMIFEDVEIRVTYLQEKNYSYYTVRQLELEEMTTGATRQVLHFHYTTWPDFGVPQSPAAFLNFLVAVRQSGALESDVGPAVIHCSAGIGRSGTFCLVDTCLIIIEKTGDSNSVNIRDILIDMRKYRMGLIQTPDQLRFSYLAIIEGSKRIAANTLNSMVMDEEIPNVPVRSASLADEVPEVPPPLPPRRKRAGSGQENGSTKREEESQEEKSVQGILRESESEIRRRKREERKKNSAEQIARMKRKQQEHEASKNRKVFFRPYIIGGLSVAALVGSFILYKYLSPYP